MLSPSGIPEVIKRVRIVTYSATLFDLMQSYTRIRTRDEFRPFVTDRDALYTMEEALDHMRGLIGFAGAWTDISSYLSEAWLKDSIKLRSATAATFAAWKRFFAT